MKLRIKEAIFEYNEVSEVRITQNKLAFNVIEQKGTLTKEQEENRQIEKMQRLISGRIKSFNHFADLVVKICEILNTTPNKLFGF